jgi:hypothetical protein
MKFFSRKVKEKIRSLVNAGENGPDLERIARKKYRVLV